MDEVVDELEDEVGDEVEDTWTTHPPLRRCPPLLAT